MVAKKDSFKTKIKHVNNVILIAKLVKKQLIIVLLVKCKMKSYKVILERICALEKMYVSVHVLIVSNINLKNV